MEKIEVIILLKTCNFLEKMIIPELSEPTVRTLRATIPGNESQLNLIWGN